MRSTLRGTAAAVLATSMIAASGFLPLDHFGVNVALANGDHGDHGSDHGGGNGGGGGGGGGNGAGGNDHGNASAHGGNSASTPGDDASRQEKASTASALGGLNAAHASPSALAHAAPNSRVGEVAAYKSAVGALNEANSDLGEAKAALAADLAAHAPAATIAADKAAVASALSAQRAAQAAAAQALATAANKSITATVVRSLDSLLGISLTSPTTPARLAAQAAALQLDRD